MDDVENSYAQKSSLIRRIFSTQMLLFVLANLIYFAASWVQMYAGEFVLQESGELDSITSYDYILPAINSAATLVILAVFLLLGYIAYGKDRVKMLRFPMAFCFSAVIGSFLSSLFTALCSSPIIDFSDMQFNIMQVQSYVVVVLRFLASFAFFFYFDAEKESDGYYLEEYYVENPSAYNSLRAKIVSNKFAVLWVVLIVCLGSELIGQLARSGFTAALMAVPDEYLWLSYYIEVVSGIATYGLYILLAWYFARNMRTTAKLLGLIYFVSHAMNSFSFVTNSITNVFAQAGDNLLNSVFSTIFVGVAVSVIYVIRLLLTVLLCSRLRKMKED